MRRPSRAWKPSLFPLTLLLALALPGSAALAMGSESAATPAARPAEQADYAAGKQAIASKNWQAALDAFNKVVASDPGNANAHNFLGYAYRKLGKLDLAFKHYEEALRLDPTSIAARTNTSARPISSPATWRRRKSTSRRRAATAAAQKRQGRPEAALVA